MCLSLINGYRFFYIYSCKTFKITLLLSLAVTLTCLLSIGESHASVTFGAFSLVNTNNNFLTYQDNSLGLRIDYPAGWIHELHAGGLVTFLPSLEDSSNTYPAGLGITVEHLKSKNMRLSDITKIQIKNLTQNHSDFRLLQSTEFRVAGNIANKIVFTATDSMNHERKAMQIWTLNGDKAYLITYKAEPGQYSNYLPTIEKMVDSIQFIK